MDREIDQKTRLQVLEQEQYREIGRLRKYEKEVEEIKKENEKLSADRALALKSDASSKQKLADNATVMLGIKRQLAAVQKELRLKSTKSVFNFTCLFYTLKRLKDTENELAELKVEKEQYLDLRDTQLDTLRREMTAEYQRSQVHWAADMEKRAAAAEAEVRGQFEAVIDTLENEKEELKKELSTKASALDRVTKDYDSALELRQVCNT